MLASLYFAYAATSALSSNTTIPTPCIDVPCCFFPDSAGKLVGSIQGEFCGRIENDGGAGTPYHPHLSLIINCPAEQDNLPVKDYRNKPSFYAIGDVGTPDYVSGKVECAGYFDSLQGSTVSVRKTMETTSPVASGKNRSCFLGGGDAGFTVVNDGNGGLVVQGFNMYGETTSSLHGNLTLCTL
jgi:hypothetical protein